MKYALLLLILICLAMIAGCSTDEVLVTEPEPRSPVIMVPTDQPTIRAAFEFAVDGDTVMLEPGIYTGEGNRDISFNGKAIVLTSVEGPGSTIIDIAADSTDQHFGFEITSREHDAVIEGVTIRGAYFNQGAAILLRSTDATIRNCVFADNHATVSGGAVRCKGSSPTITNCTFVGNSSLSGAGLLVIATSSPIVENCIFANSTAGGAIYNVDGSSVPQMTCCLIFNNVGGDWMGSIAAQSGTNGNLPDTADPMFCDPAEGGYTLKPGSPCLPENNNCNELIGALGADCQ